MLSVDILCNVTFAPNPPLLESFFSWESSSGQARIAFDMHSSHNLIASFSKEMHELKLNVWPWLKLSRACVSAQLLIKELKSFIPRLITTIPSNTIHLSFGTPSSQPLFPKQEAQDASHSVKMGNSLMEKRSFSKSFKKKPWWVVIWWWPGLAGCLGCRDWKSTNEGLLSEQD